jgi:O-antigen/teichoic acid export membrane protein
MQAARGLLTLQRGGLRLNVLIGMVAKGGTVAISFVFTFLIARTYGASGVGIYAISSTTAIIGSTIALSGMEYILLRAVAVNYGQDALADARAAVGVAVRQIAVSSVLLGGALFLASRAIAEHWVGDAAAIPFLRVMALAVPIVAFTKLASATLRASGRVVVSQAIDGPLGTGGAAILLALLALSGNAGPAFTPAVLYCLCSGAAAVFGWIYLMRLVRRWPRGGLYAERTLIAGLPIVAVTLSNMFADWFATVVLAGSVSPSEAGLFRIAFQIASTLNILIVAAESILSPTIAHEYRAGNVARVASIVHQAALGMLVFAAPILLAVAFAPHALLALFGPEFKDAALCLQILCVSQFINLVTGPVGMIIVMTHHERWALTYGLGGAALSAALCLVLVPGHGAVGAAIAVSSATLLRKLAGTFIVRRVIGVPIFGRLGPMRTR